jgi:hypothetical protein
MKLGFFDNNWNWNIEGDEIKILQKTFDLFYRNRLSSEELKKTKFEEKNTTFQPQILQASKEMATNYREKVLE